MGTWGNEHKCKDKYQFAPSAPMRICQEFICYGAHFPNCPFVRSAQLPYGPTAYFTRINLLLIFVNQFTQVPINLPQVNLHFKIFDANGANFLVWAINADANAVNFFR